MIITGIEGREALASELCAADYFEFIIGLFTALAYVRHQLQIDCCKCILIGLHSFRRPGVTAQDTWYSDQTALVVY